VPPSQRHNTRLRARILGGNVYKRILIHVDGSLQAGHSVRLGINLARTIGAHPILLHVSREGTVSQALDSQRHSEHGLELLRRERNMASRNGRAPDARFERSHDIAETIVRVAQDENCDLIILASHRRDDLERLYETGLAEQVIRATTIPVLIEQGRPWAESRATLQPPAVKCPEDQTLVFAKSNAGR
jgi:nucleotide-binding universal stress UspA family protein